MYKIIMVSPGGTKRDFHGGFDSAVAAENHARESGYEYCDENGFVWRLEVVDEEPQIVDLYIPEQEWKDTFLEFRQHGDDQALLYLSDVFENTFDRHNRIKYSAIRNLVESLIYLNKIIALMEFDEIPTNLKIEEAYRILMTELHEIAEKPQSIE